MANYSRWEDVKKKRPGPDAETRAGVEQELALGQLIYDLRTEAPVSASASSPSGWVPRWWEFYAVTDDDPTESTDQPASQCCTTPAQPGASSACC